MDKYERWRCQCGSRCSTSTCVANTAGTLPARSLLCVKDKNARMTDGQNLDNVPSPQFLWFVTLVLTNMQSISASVTGFSVSNTYSASASALADSAMLHQSKIFSLTNPSCMFSPSAPRLRRSARRK